MGPKKYWSKIFGSEFFLHEKLKLKKLGWKFFGSKKYGSEIILGKKIKVGNFLFKHFLGPKKFVSEFFL